MVKVIEPTDFQEETDLYEEWKKTQRFFSDLSLSSEKECWYKVQRQVSAVLKGYIYFFTLMS